MRLIAQMPRACNARRNTGMGWIQSGSWLTPFACARLMAHPSKRRQYNFNRYRQISIQPKKTLENDLALSSFDPTEQNVKISKSVRAQCSKAEQHRKKKRASRPPR